jgi:hypothetical protein
MLDVFGRLDKNLHKEAQGDQKESKRCDYIFPFGIPRRYLCNIMLFFYNVMYTKVERTTERSL